MFQSPAYLSGLLPLPRNVVGEGHRVPLSPEASIVADQLFLSQAELLAERLRKGTGWEWPVFALNVRGKGPSIVFRSSQEVGGPEGYRLETSDREISIAASHPAGAFYAGQTLLQLLPSAIFNDSPAPDANWTLSAVVIEDWPEFRWRGVMLDSVRHFQPVSWVKKFIELLAQHKINVLHWHLTDDQGWRIEIRKYPLLTGVGARRTETLRGHLSQKGGGDGIPVEGFYSQDEIREVVAFAQARNINILPEIEMPGHARAAVAAYPHLGCSSEPVAVAIEWGIHPYLFNVRPETLDFLKNVLYEVTRLFPFEYVHVGGDEAVKTQWKNDPDTQACMKELGLADENALQSWFVTQMAEFLRTRGKKLVGWDEILEGGVVEGAVVMSWRGGQGAIEAANLGQEAVMCTKDAFYFDYGQSEDPLCEPLHIGGCNSLRKVYETNPVPAEISDARAGCVVGVQGQLWTEYMPTTSRLEYMAFPRVCALSEVGWSDPRAKQFGDFLGRLSRHLRRLDCQDVRYRSPGDAA